MTKKELLEIIADVPEDAVISISGNKYYPIKSVRTRCNLDTPSLYPKEAVPPHIFFLVDDEETVDDFKRVLTSSCNTDCPRFCAGTCPFSYSEKTDCPRVKQTKALLEGIE